MRQRKISNNNNNNKRKIEKRSLQLTYANDKKEGKTKTRKVWERNLLDLVSMADAYRKRTKIRDKRKDKTDWNEPTCEVLGPISITWQCTRDSVRYRDIPTNVTV